MLMWQLTKRGKNLIGFWHITKRVFATWRTRMRAQVCVPMCA